MGIFSKNPRISFPVNMSPKVCYVMIENEVSGVEPPPHELID